MLDVALNTHAFNMQWAKMLTADVADEDMCRQPGGIGLANHPAWVLGHLALTLDRGVCKALGLPATLPENCDALFNAGTTPTQNRALYPPKAELLAALESQHNRVSETLPKVDSATLAQPPPDEMARRFFPTVEHFVTSLLTSHEGSHLGQLNDWRRTSGMKSAFGV